METYKITIFNRVVEVIRDNDGKFIKPKIVTNAEGIGTALKPAVELICMARKPLSEKTVAENVLKYGTGGINIDECRIGTEYISNHGRNKDDYGFTSGEYHSNKTWQGRFPANLIHDGSDVVMAEFEKYGVSKSTASIWNGFSGKGSNEGWVRKSHINKIEGGFNDSGTPARFFYCAKASKSERDMGCEGLAFKKQEIATIATNTHRCEICGKWIDNSPSKSKRVSRPKSSCWCENPVYSQIVTKDNPIRNNHPTVKPIKLMEYLIKPVTTDKAIVLDPFAGSGSTLVACRNLRRNYIGIELSQEYIDIANKRIAEIKQQLTLI